MKVHIDTDIGSNIDDVCAIAYAMASPDIELVGITTNTEDHGRRAGYARYLLDLGGHSHVPVAPGFKQDAQLLGDFRRFPPEEDFWPERIAPLEGEPDAASKLLRKNVEDGATVVAIGALSNVAQVVCEAPELFTTSNLAVMGGYLFPPPLGFPQWPAERDSNIQICPGALMKMLESAPGVKPLFVPLAVTLQTSLRRSHMPTLEQGGPVSRLIAMQATAYSKSDAGKEHLAAKSRSMARDTINFQHDPLAVAIAAGWSEGVTVEEFQVRLMLEESVRTWDNSENSALVPERYAYFEQSPRGKAARFVTAVDGPSFDQHWLEVVSLI